MKMHFINVGYGEAIFVERNGFTILIDGGTNRPEEYECPGCIRVTEYLESLGVNQIDLVIITHIHDDHIGGITDIIRNFPVKQVWINVKPGKMVMDMVERFESVIDGNLSSTLFRNALASYGEIYDACEHRGIPFFQKGTEDGGLTLAEGFEIEILTPHKALQKEVLALFSMLLEEKDPGKAEALFRAIDQGGNRSSISLRIKAGKAAALLSGDKVDGWEEIYKQRGNTLESQILKLTHHGQRDGMPSAMVELSQPEIFVVCTSADKRFHSAHPDVVERAEVFLREKGKSGGVYITGCLQPDLDAAWNEKPEDRNEIYAVWFDCDENTGQITPHYSVKKGGSA